MCSGNVCAQAASLARALAEATLVRPSPVGYNWLLIPSEKVTPMSDLPQIILEHARILNEAGIPDVCAIKVTLTDEAQSVFWGLVGQSDDWSFVYALYCVATRHLYLRDRG